MMIVEINFHDFDQGAYLLLKVRRYVIECWNLITFWKTT